MKRGRGALRRGDTELDQRAIWSARSGQLVADRYSGQGKKKWTSGRVGGLLHKFVSHCIPQAIDPKHK